MTKLVNRAKMSTATTGTGTITLGSAEAGYQSFTAAGVVDGDVVRYVIEDGTAFEIGTGTFTASGTTLTRTVSESSNADAALNLTGDAVVFVSATAADIPPALELYAENPSSPVAPSATGTNAVAIGTGASASGFAATALGENSSASGTRGTAIGGGSVTGNSTSIAIGSGALASANVATAIGPLTDATSAGALAIGYSAQAVSGSYATAVSRSYASGADSFAAAIGNNASSYGATGANSVAVGSLARSLSASTVAIGGTFTYASGANSVAIGKDATTFGARCFALNGGVATSADSMAIGNHAATKTVIGHIAMSGGFRFSAGGDSQQGTFILRSDTTDATPEALTSNNSTAGTTNQVILPNNSAYAFHGTIVARQQASQGTACAAFKIEGLIRREGNAASTVLVNSATTVLDNTPGWGMALSADTTNGGLKIEVTGAAATNIRFVATISTSEVTF